MALPVDSKEIPKKEERNMTSVSFKEVAVYFSEEEWSRLDSWQKELYSNVMRDIHTTLLSLGYTILHPDVLCRIRRNHKPYVGSQEEDRKGICFPSTSASVLSSDIIFKTKRDEELCANEGDPTDSCTKGASVLSPDIIFRIKHDEDVCTDEEDCKDGKEGFPSAMSDVLINKGGKSGGEQKVDQKDNPSHEDLTSETSAANHLVFNPKFSIWIKQVDEVTPEVLSAARIDKTACKIKSRLRSLGDTKKLRKSKQYTTDGDETPELEYYTSNIYTYGNVKEIKTEIDLTLDCKLPPPQDLTEATPDKITASEIRQIPEKDPALHKEEHAGKGGESLLSIVLRRANAGSLCLPNYKCPSSYEDMDDSRGFPRTVERETRYPPKRSFFQAPNSNDLLSSFHDPPAPPQHCAPQIDKPFRCHLCDKCFKTLGILNVHMKTHSGVRPYQCSECGKSFRDNWNLKVHQKIHTGETPYRCAICNKGFIQYATYMKHQRIHTGERPYSCCYCDKSFTNSSNLVRHYRTHTGEKPYVCMECGKCFSYNTSLIQHRRSHKVEPVQNGTNGPSNK